MSYLVTIMPKRRNCSLNEDLAKEFPFIKKFKSDSDVQCKTCLAIFSIANGGKSDITRHLNADKHKNAVVAASSS